MKILMYMSCALMTMGMVYGAGYLPAPIADQEVILGIISNGFRDGSGACHNAITGALRGCQYPDTSSPSGYSQGLHAIHLLPPADGMPNCEKIVNWVIPFEDTSIPKAERHLHPKNCILYVTRTYEGKVVVHQELHGKVVDKPVFEYVIPRDFARILLLMEISTKGKCRITRPSIDDSLPIPIPASQVHTPLQSQYPQHHGHGHGKHKQ